MGSNVCDFDDVSVSWACDSLVCIADPVEKALELRVAWLASWGEADFLDSAAADCVRNDGG